MNGQFTPFGETCNGKIFFYYGSSEFLIVYIILTSLVQLFLIYKMMRLCSIAFSYSNFHVHQTYKLYALAIINIAIVLLTRKSQYDYQQYQLHQNDPNYIDPRQKGYELVNDLFGILSIYTNNYMHIYNGFTWLLISLSCDYNVVKQPSSVLDQLTLMTEDYQLRRRKDTTKKRVYYLKTYTIHCLLMGMLIISVLGTLSHVKDQDPWCGVVAVTVVVSSFLPLGVFGAAVYFYAGRFWDPEVSILTKLGLIYLLVAMVIRVLYFLISSVKQLDFGGDPLNLCYTVFCTLMPIIVMSFLGEMQLKNQQYTLLRRSSLMFRSTVI